MNAGGRRSGELESVLGAIPHEFEVGATGPVGGFRQGVVTPRTMRLSPAVLETSTTYRLSGCRAVTIEFGWVAGVSW